jgi:ABC-type polysaccharide/polyol phosphate transport system ATPase subunit
MITHIASESTILDRKIPGNEPVIRFENIAVLYRVPRERVSGIKEYTVRWLQRRLIYEEFWALQDINFEVQRGEVFGVIGRNGAGKSTMLKVMARVLHPTRGRIVMRGKIAPLLELGAGFHPELTGRENIYLNSSLLGHTRKQVDGLFASIVDFAEIGDFIDAPLRTFSTGMVARLGFSVATCMRPDVLLVDEVLSVGDSRFQDKCLERMNAYQKQGTTIVIVSHSMETIRNFCSRALLLDHGRATALGDVVEVIQHYTG